MENQKESKKKKKRKNIQSNDHKMQDQKSGNNFLDPSRSHTFFLFRRKREKREKKMGHIFNRTNFILKTVFWFGCERTVSYPILYSRLFSRSLFFFCNLICIYKRFSIILHFLFVIVNCKLQKHWLSRLLAAIIARAICIILLFVCLKINEH